MRRSILLGAALATAALIALPSSSSAQGFGFRIGNVGVGVGNYGYGGYGYGGYGYGIGRGYGYPYYGSSYYGSPYGFRYGYAPSYSYSRWYSPSYYSADPSYSYYSAIPSTTTTQSFYQGSQPEVSQNAAYVRVSVPTNARLWFQDQETTQRGNERVFYSPPLTPGKDFIYTLKAAWTDANGKEVTRTREVRVHAGDFVNVDMRPGTDSTSAYPPADQAKPAPADNNGGAYRGPREVTPLTPGTPPIPAQETNGVRTTPAQPATTTNNTTNVVVPGGVGIAPNLGPTTPVPPGTTARPGTNQPNVVPPVNTSTPGTPPTPSGTAPIGPATPINPAPLNPNAGSNLPGPAPR